jgi:hypothetical protein
MIVVTGSLKGFELPAALRRAAQLRTIVLSCAILREKVIGGKGDLKASVSSGGDS